MWVRSAAIRPIPPHAELSVEAIRDAEDWIGGGDLLDADLAEQRLQRTFERFEAAQPALAERIGRVLARTADEVAVALGFYLSSALWLAFHRAFSDRLSELSETVLDGVEQSLALDEQLRGSDPIEAVDSDDVVAMEQPNAVEFIQEHIDAALEEHAEEADVDSVHVVYRMMLVEVLALSYAVRPPAGSLDPDSEICA